MNDTTTWDDEDGPVRPVWQRPVPAILIGAVLMIAILWFGPTPSNTRLLDLALYSIGFVLLIWIAAHFLALRHAGIAWTLVNLIVLFWVCVLGQFGKVAVTGWMLQRDLASVLSSTRQLIATSDNPEADITLASNGPISSAYNRYLGALRNDQRDYRDASSQAGVAQILSLDGMTKASPVLNNCDDIDALTKIIDKNEAHFKTLATGIRAEIAAMEFNPDAKAEFLNGFDRSQRTSVARFADNWAYERRSIAEVSGMCRILARRKWEKQGEMLMFNEQADLSGFNRRANALRALQDEIATANAAQMNRLSDQLSDLDR